MRIIKRSAIEDYWKSHPDAEGPLRDWYAKAKRSNWANFPDVKRTFGQTDQCRVASGNVVYVFDIGGNKHRLIARVSHNKAKVYVLRVMTHKEYDRERWEEGIMSTTTNAKGRRASRGRDHYMDLVREFPLRPIRTKAEYAAAGRMLDRLVTRDENSLDRGEADYLEVLEDLIEVYDTKHTTLDRADDRPPLDRLKSLLAGAGVGVADFGRIIGSVSNASMILKGKRELSKEHIRKLAAHFRMDAGYFL